jgi:predicted secreted protein
MTAFAVGAGVMWAGNALAGETPSPGGSSATGPETMPTPAGRIDGESNRIDVFGPSKAPNKPVLVSVGDELVVHLTEQAGSTGYSWFSAGVPEILTATGDQVIPSVTPPGESSPVGAPGEHVFTFTVVGSGAGKVTFTLRRPWEPAATQTITFRITVRP